MEVLDYGVCRLALVPVRGEAKNESVQITQLLFGDHYEVTAMSPDKKWLKIRIYFDQCEGWLDARQHHAITKEYFNQINITDYKITTEISSPVLYKKSPIAIVMGSIVPISSSELFKIEEQFAFNGESKSLGLRRDADFLKTIARKYLHAPDQSGGKSPFGIDASGLTQMVYRITGYAIPRQAVLQANAGKKIKSFSEAAIGDLAFFSDKGKTVSHAGIIMGDEKIIHVSGQVRIDPVTEEGILDADKKVYTHLLHSIRRILS